MRQTPGDKAVNNLHSDRVHPHAVILLKPAYLAVTVLDDHQHWGVLALHRPVQCLNAHAVLRGAESQRPRVADCPWREIFGKLKACAVGEWQRGKKGGNQRLQGCSNQRSITSAVTF